MKKLKKPKPMMRRAHVDIDLFKWVKRQKNEYHTVHGPSQHMVYS